MSEGIAIMELTSKGQEIMAKMASEHAEQNTQPTYKELRDEFEALIKAEHPDEDLARIYTRCYGILLAHITKAQLIEVIRLHKEYK
jgi:hypothetical protein